MSTDSATPVAEPQGTALAAPQSERAERPPSREISTDTRPLDYFNDQRSFEIGQRQALLLSRTSILPDAYRHEYQVKKNGEMVWVQNPDAVGNCFVALEYAQRLDVSPLVVMQQMDMIHGRPGLRGTFLIGLVNGKRQFTELNFECNNLEGDAYGYRCYATRLSDGKECVGPWVTWKMVKAEKWQEKSGSKWNSMPELMFQYRAASFWSRLFAPHITLGLQESEELRDTYNVIEHDGDARRGRVSSEAPEGERNARGSLAALEADVMAASAGSAAPDAPASTSSDDGAQDVEETKPAATEPTPARGKKADAPTATPAAAAAATPAEPDPNDLFKTE